ncbi:MAG: 50S ribosomal protein L2 [Candidatus Kerfeldbacteria bacterium CG08_land_8_20_14_0_20_43_14]|uniref:Large ribosomal subunit protein uL2 n=1 Tax=Candidatus Kerfeldbacteria bacterium CG08_land_8_20_14_0_20_43_14 TaxID=2014246 RepID=A0A2H0YPR8_9BACT|nr:MAG: 50S ribosomal protein L2 [Candidatus Kerfeldbacteria bacterium CG08_land_8_20_14_0_20_43_14]
MAVKLFKPTTPGRRFASVSNWKNEVSKSEPEKSLLVSKNRKAGRNNQGKITMRHRGGGAKRKIRIIDFLQNKLNVPAKVISIEYDPNRTGYIALLQYPDGEKRYIIASADLKPGMEVINSDHRVEITPSNRMPLKDIPIGMQIHNLELVPGHGAIAVRSAGSWATVMAVEGNMAQVKMSSGEIRSIPSLAKASLGQVSNLDHRNVRLGKAGRHRHQGFRPTVRGKAMNPVDHPHGGGEGNQPIGMKHPKTPWGKPALGVLTRKKGKHSNRFILKSRKLK